MQCADYDFFFSPPKDKFPILLIIEPMLHDVEAGILTPQPPARHMIYTGSKIVVLHEMKSGLCWEERFVSILMCHR